MSIEGEWWNFVNFFTKVMILSLLTAFVDELIKLVVFYWSGILFCFCVYQRFAS